MDISCRVHAFGVAALLSTTIIASSAQAIEVAATNDAMAIADQLFLSQSSISVTGATLSFGEPCEMIDGVCFGGEFGEGGEVPPNLDIGLLTIGVSSGVDQIGTYTNNVGTFGLPSPGVVMSTGNVMDYGTGPNLEDEMSSSANNAATLDQNTILGPITGFSEHFDPVELDITFDVGDGVDMISFIGVFGSEEFPEYVDSEFNDGFGIFINGTNVASALETGATPGVDTALPINVDHPDIKPVAGTELNGILAPNDIPLVRFDVPVTPNSTGNQLKVIIADTSDSILDTTVYLSSFGDFDANDGSSEFTPLLPSNTPGPDGLYVFELDAPEPGQTIWIDPPVSVGFEYTIDGAEFASVTAPSLLTVDDPDGYEIVVGGTTVVLLPGETHFFGTPVSDFILQGIDEALMLDPSNPVAFPIGYSVANVTSTTNTVTMKPLTVDPGMGVIPLPGTAALYLLGMVGFAGFARRKSA